VKVVGVLGLIDDNECDWKIIGINSEDHWCNEIHGTHAPIAMGGNPLT
jgi:inorganic pyrophosphatase